jgi:hypothetical protein
VGLGTTVPVGGLVVMTGNVGFGTWSPYSKLEVRSTAANSNVLSVTNSTGNLGGMFYENAAGAMKLELRPASGGADVSLEAGSGADNYILSGNFGIGDAGPDAVLEVSASGGTTDLLMLSSDDNNDGNRLIVKNSGNVGIGTINPSFLLQVAKADTGTFSAGTSSTAAIGIINTDTTNNNSDMINFGMTNSVGINVTGVRLVGVMTNHTSGTETADFAVVTRNTGGALGERMRINSVGSVGIGTTLTAANTGLAIMNGNVGIGTWSAGAGLQVNNTINYASEFDNGSKGGAFTIDWNNGNKQKVTLTGSTAHAATFTAPLTGVGNYMLKIVQGDASNTVSWSGVKWPASTSPTLTTTSGATDIVSCYYDRSSYYCTGSLAFGP